MCLTFIGVIFRRTDGQKGDVLLPPGGWGVHGHIVVRGWDRLTKETEQFTNDKNTILFSTETFFKIF